MPSAMTLRHLLSDQPKTVHLPEQHADTRVYDICDDSRQATAGCLFIARNSSADTSPYLADAMKCGPGVVICHEASAGDLPQKFPEAVWIYVDPATSIDQGFVGRLAERFFDYPSHKLDLIGITGTNGKTTTAMLTQHLLTEAGLRCGMIGTVVVDDGLNRTPASLTTPGAVEFSRLLSQMVANGCTAAVAELSSHGLDQGRTAALDIDVAVFTNLTGDHLDYHGTMDAYAAAKARLFEQLPGSAWAIVNADDPWHQRMLIDCDARVLRCTVTDSAMKLIPGDHERTAADCCTAEVHSLAADHCTAEFAGPWGGIKARLPIGGRHNIANALQALAAANAVAAMARRLPDALQSAPAVPGRLEPVTCESDRPGPTVLVDYAHTHDALENVLKAVCPVTTGAVWVVFGCGGDRDRTKRPKMAAIACQLADRIIITSDNPRTEDPDAIIKDVLKGVPQDANSSDRIQVEPDRRKAIRTAIHAAGKDDLVLIAGKGHEDYQILGTNRIHFDDRLEAQAALVSRPMTGKLSLAGTAA